MEVRVPRFNRPAAASVLQASGSRSDVTVIEAEPVTARFTYHYFPRDDGGDGDRPVYEWRIYGGDRKDTPVSSDPGPLEGALS